MVLSNPRFVLALLAVSSFGNFLSVDGKCKIEPVDGHVDWPSKKKTIKNNAFKKCKDLRTIFIPPEVESIHNTAFYKSGLDLIELQNYGRSPNNMTVNVQIVTDGLYDQYATLLLYMHDKLLADAPAALAAVEFSVFPETQSSFLFVLRPDMAVRQNGRSWEEMMDPSFYVSLDVGKSSLTYENGPVFGVAPGSTVELVLKTKVPIFDPWFPLPAPEPLSPLPELIVVDVNDGRDYFKELLIATTSVVTGVNTCEGMNPKFPNVDCLGEDSVVDVSEQAGQNVTEGYIGGMDSEIIPITDFYYKVGLCPVNVHWHAGAEHYSAGEFDCLDHDKCGPYHGEGHHSSSEEHVSSEEDPISDEFNAADGSMSMSEEDEDVAADEEMPTAPVRRQRRTAGDVRVGFQCGNLYDADDEKFTQPYDWQFCDQSMEVGQTYEVHWPHSSAGACDTPNQYQTPFKDGVFCNLPVEALNALSPQDIAFNVGVQSQTFVIVNDENYYYGNLLGGMLVEGDFGSDMAIYTGSTTGTSVNNEVCSQYTPITWQVDRKCHMISASSFDKMCADMMAQRDDMTDDLSAHGARELVADFLSSNNQVRKLEGERKNLPSRN